MSSISRFEHIDLQTHLVADLLDFYRNALDLKVVATDAAEFTVHIGTTTIRFVQTARRRPVYHLAFNIPTNKVEAALGWLVNRVEIVPHHQTGAQVINWPAWNAQSIYFRDTAGNILEVIARQNLANAAGGAFNSADLLGVSEIGIVVPDPHATIDLLSSVFGLPKKSVMRDFGAVGDDRGLFIVSAPGRPWMPTSDVPAEAFPASAVIDHVSTVDLHLAGTEYHLIGTPGPLTHAHLGY